MLLSVIESGNLFHNNSSISARDMVLFDRDVKTIGKHITAIFKEGELEENVVVANFATTTQHREIKK